MCDRFIARMSHFFERLMSLVAFHSYGKEIYWLCRVKQSDSKFSNAILEKKLKVKATIRGVSTIAKMATKYPI
jgi:uncharacterized protein (DUF1697 family)